MTGKQQITLLEASEQLGVPLETVKGWVKRGRLHRANLIRSTGAARRHLVAVYDLDEVRPLVEQWRVRTRPTRGT